MSRTSLIMAMVAMSLAVRVPAGARNPHLDPSAVTGGCPACHQGHGASRSPMLPGAQKQLCLSCHGSLAERNRRTAEGAVSLHARPALLGTITEKLYAHPLDETATAAGTGVVTCTSCHSPHRGGRDERVDWWQTKGSPRDPGETEFELCGSCHGRQEGRRSQVARKLDPNNRSFHPVEAPSPDRAGSVDPEMSGHRIACTDCHGNDDRQGPRGPHASNVPFLLNAGYRQSDGAESLEAFALCYRCHSRTKVLEAEPHPKHVGVRGAACRTCHDGHGSVSNRSLVHIGESETVQHVLPSLTTGRLQFVSERRSTGSCHLTCHGADHAPKSYGITSRLAEMPPIGGGPPAPITPPIQRAPALGELPRGPIERPAPGDPRPQDQP